jgi:hypothetical protein
MRSMFPELSDDQKAVLAVVDDFISYKDIQAKLPGLTYGRVLGVLNNLQRRRLVENKAGMWFRTEAGERLVSKHDL